MRVAEVRLGDIGEYGFIQRIADGSLIRAKGVRKGIGDDCCVFETSATLLTLVTTDMLVEGVHFIREHTTPFKLGRKSMAVVLSDIAAMGGIPRESLISIAIPRTTEVHFLDSLYQGLKSMAREFQVNLLGGDTSLSPEHLFISVTVVGEVSSDEVLYRSGAQVGDVIFLTGPVGASAAGLDILTSGRGFDAGKELVEAHRDPYPHIRAGRIIAGLKVANSLIDVSDGLASDLMSLCNESGLGAVIEKEKIPTLPGFDDYCRRFKPDVDRLLLHSGEDYVLLGTIPEGSCQTLKRALVSDGCQFHPIGEIAKESGIRMKYPDGTFRKIAPEGYSHF